MTVRMFKPQFAPLVESGAKTQTVRPVPKRLPKPGDKMSCRMWTGKPYRSKQRLLFEVMLTRVAPVSIYDTWCIELAGKQLTPDEEYNFAKADGFKTVKDFFEWFKAEHGLPFNGVLLEWKP